MVIRYTPRKRDEHFRAAKTRLPAFPNTWETIPEGVTVQGEAQ